MSASEPGPVTYAFGTYSTPAERKARGKAARETLPRTAMGDYSPSAHRPDPIAMLEDQEQTRVPNLLPLRHERMGVSAFTFYRGTAIIMANDLGAQTSSGLQVQLCGDAHLSNFGLLPRPTASRSSTSTTSTRPTRGPSSGTSSASRRRLSWRRATTAFPRMSSPTRRWPARGSIACRWLSTPP